MNFKDDLKADIATFLDLDEFAEFVTIDKVILPAQVIRHTAEKSARLTENFAGLHGDFVTVYFAAEPYYKKRQKLPRHGEWIYINGTRFDVVSAQEEFGIIKVVCSAYRQQKLAPRPLA